MRKQPQVSYQEIISLENLFAAWREFACGKREKKDVQDFGLHLADNILQLYEELSNFTYGHGDYKAFNISDPKPRNIHKADVRDRVLHHAIYRQLYPFFEKVFIADSYSCRNDKGTHKAINRFKKFYLQESKNSTRTVWVLKCDIKKFFASIDHKILLCILESCIADKNIIWLLKQVIGSFSIQEDCSAPIPYRSTGQVYRRSKYPDSPINGHTTQSGAGLPLGNLTSQLFCNVYMNEFDRFAKHKLKTKYYIRFADDFVFLSVNKNWLLSLIPQVAAFLDERLKLRLHPDKIFIKTLASGVDFLGWVNFPHYRVLRRTATRRMFKRICEHPKNETLQSYLGFISHGNTFRLKQEVFNWYWLLKDKIEG